MGYNYRNGGMPDFHAAATDISGGNGVHDQASTVGSPNATTPQVNPPGLMSGAGNAVVNGFMQGGTIKSGIDAGKGYLENQGIQAAGKALQPVASSAGSAIAQGVKSGVSALASLI